MPIFINQSTVAIGNTLLVTPENATSNNTEFNQHIPTNTIPLATISSDESLAAIFPFELEENTTIPLFSGAALKEKLITAMYTDARVDGHPIKLILDSGSAGSIITKQLMNQLGCRVDQAASTRIITANGVTKTPISEIDDFPFEVNSIITPIKVLVIEAIQYQALIGNNWLFKANATLDWNTQELQLMYQGQHICVLATCGHFKTPPREKLLIELEEEKEKPTWKAYQVSWADKKHNKLLPILFWNDNNKKKGKQKKKLTWETNDLTWTDNDKSEPTSSWEWEEDKENKGKEKEKETTQTTTAYNTYTTPQRSTYRQSKLICVNCGKWDNQPCLACGETLLDEGMWHDISGCGGTCDISCQYTILISDWVRKETPIEAVWKKAIQRLDSCPHDDNKIWQMALAKIKGVMPEEIKMIKDNLPKLLELDWDTEPIINLLDPEQFHEHYQELAPTRKEQEQQLEQLNA
ncbi:hypothetical protein G9A89_011140 [Geosiphon pyriformis]|nr:hypothetical protein G9A89_011140 [Geosiphon pyriformis]